MGIWDETATEIHPDQIRPTWLTNARRWNRIQTQSALRAKLDHSARRYEDLSRPTLIGNPNQITKDGSGMCIWSDYRKTAVPEIDVLSSFPRYGVKRKLPVNSVGILAVKLPWQAFDHAVVCGRWDDSRQPKSGLCQ